ncbi:hypothetical protein [Variovorax sp. RA8]|uniref:hypothetical protein n=1 Tax=Variovorax sp. (strain JCM 16519 / RA8) TaxID=662548 RepID=UPI000B33FE99|nr:hypothetical protein [Variovorax sp. RA8]VTU28632.1 hypothetical protein RA8CHR_03790 [Variovorax sp. RA8]
MKPLSQAYAVTSPVTCKVTKCARRWLDVERLLHEVAGFRGVLLDAPDGECDLLVTCGTEHGERWDIPPDARKVVSITAPLRAHAHVVDITPPHFHSGLAEASILAVLERLYDLRETERLLREKLPRPRRVTATMLKGKRVGILASPRTSLEFAGRLCNWGVTVLCTSPQGKSTNPDGNQVFVDPAEMHAQCDIVVDARVGAETGSEVLGAIVPAFSPTLEVREAATEAVMAFLRSAPRVSTSVMHSNHHQ